MVRYPGPAPKLRLCAGIALYQAWEIILEGTFYSQGKQLQLMPVKDLHSWASLCSLQHAVPEFLGGRGDIRGPSSAKTLSLRLFLVNVQLHIRDVIPYRDMLTVPLMPFHPCRVWDCVSYEGRSLRNTSSPRSSLRVSRLSSPIHACPYPKAMLSVGFTEAAAHCGAGQASGGLRGGKEHSKGYLGSSWALCHCLT